MFDNKNLMWL